MTNENKKLIESYLLQDQIFDTQKEKFLNQNISKLNKNNFKCLFVIVVGEGGKNNLIKIIKKLGKKYFDYFIFVHDKHTILDELIFSGCRIIYESGILYYFLKKYVNPELAESYDYIFWSVDDIDISGFNYKNILHIMETNLLDVVSPALSKDSYYSHEITLCHETSVGRLTDMLELFLLIFKSDKYCLFWEMVKSEYNYWGWGYTTMMKSYLNFKLGIVDTEIIKHTRPIRPSETRSEAFTDREKFMQELYSYKNALFISYGELK